MGTTSPTEPDNCGVWGGVLERDRDGSTGAFPFGGAGPSPERGGAAAASSRASKMPRQL
jgi:hypothetical protein